MVIEGLEQSYIKFFFRLKQKAAGKLLPDENVKEPQFRKKFKGRKNFTIKGGKASVIKITNDSVRLQTDRSDKA